MTLFTDVEKIRRDLDRVIAAAEQNAAGVSSHEQQISGDRGITDTLQQLSGEIKTLHSDLTELSRKVSAVEKAFAEWSAVAKALAEKGVSTRTFILGVIAVLIPIVVLFISLGKHP